MVSLIRVSRTHPLRSFTQKLAAMNPLTGMNWSEFLQAYRVFIGQPAQGILHILEAQRRSNWQRWVLQRLARQAAALKNVQVVINLTELTQLPADTLGGAYARHILQQGFDPEAFVTPEGSDWVNQRAALSHDIYHVITGFESDPLGEYGLAAFVLVQYRDLLNVFVLSFAVWSMIGYPMMAPKILRSILKGLRMGFRCRPIFAYAFEANWDQPLTEVRRYLKIV